jgi:hypothetical protein
MLSLINLNVVVLSIVVQSVFVLIVVVGVLERWVFLAIIVDRVY